MLLDNIGTFSKFFRISLIYPVFVDPDKYKFHARKSKNMRVI